MNSPSPKSLIALLFLFMYASDLVACAQNDSSLTATPVATAEATIGWKAGPSGRGTLMLVYGCLSTVFASTWTVLHLNVPALNEPWWKKAGRKAKWMGITILFPEFIFSKAICELRLAVADLYDMHVALRNAKLEWTDSAQPSSIDKVYLKWTWDADFGKGMRLIYQLLGLGRPTLAMDEEPVAAPQAGNDHGSSCTPSMVVRRDEGATGSDRISARTASSLALNFDDEQESNDSVPRAAGAAGHQSHAGPSENPSSQAPDAESAAPGQDQLGEKSRQSSSAGAAGQGSPRQSRRRLSLPSSSDPVHEVTWAETRKWTLVHCFYANMGGLLLTRPNGSTNVIMANTLVNATSSYCDKAVLKNLDLSKADIEDKSKADWLLKGIAITQILWLIMNVWSRAINHVPVTQLEIATVAFSLLAIATYVACWWKPKDVAQPTLLTRKPMTLVSDNNRSFQSFASRLQSPSKSNKVILDFDRPRIYNDTIWMEGELPMPRVMLVLTAVSSFVFGGLHCLAWNFEFPSEAELVLWRVASITSAVLPVISFGIAFLINLLATSFVHDRHMASVVNHLAPLGQIPPQYWELMEQEPSYSRWSLESWIVFRTTLEQKNPGDGPTDWDVEPGPQLSTDAPSKAKGIGKDDRRQLSNCHRLLREFAEHWMSIKSSADKRSLVSDPDFLYRVGRIQGENENGDRRNIAREWREYEAFLRTKLDGPIPDSAALCVRDFIISWRPAIEALEEKRDAFKKVCDQTSRTFAASAVILYTISRMVILVLLFTSLRAVPEGVYENTSWTRYLPNIS